MKLTPIRVRGKRGKTASSKSPATTNPALKKPSRLATRRVTKRPSLLEGTLPIEILERIFLLSENLSFPLASAALERALSGRSTLINVIINAFHPTWDCWFGVDRRSIKIVTKRGATDASRSSRSFENFPELFPGDPEYQSSVLASPWISVALIFEARQAWAWRFARNRWYSHSHVGPKDEDSDPDTSLKTSHDRSGGFGHFDSRDCFEYDWQLYGVNGAKPAIDFYVDVHPKTTIPDELITGPWTTEQQRLLFWLRRGGARIQPESQTWETLRMGLQNAVTHRNPGNLDGRLIQMLLLLDDFFPTRALRENGPLWPLDILEEEHDKVERLVSARERNRAGPLHELTELERRMFEYHRREVDLLTSRLSRSDRVAPHSMVAVGLVPQPRNH